MNGPSKSLPQDGIIVLLGHENDASGLSEIAKDRCDKAIELANEYPGYSILPTGGFGKDFNVTDRAHGELLRDHLLRKGILPERVLSYLNSSNTLEDALSARKIAVDRNASVLLIVTSDFHVRRARYIFQRIFPDITLIFHACNRRDNSKKLEQEEDQKLAALKAEWVNIPLYGLKGAQKEFPTVIYKSASNEHKHYDSLSNGLISGFFIVFAYPYILSLKELGWLKFLSFCISASLILVLYIMYLRTAVFARTARRIMHWIEAQYGQPGFAVNYPRQDLASQIGVMALRLNFLIAQLRIPPFSVASRIAHLDYPKLATLVAVFLVLVQLIVGLAALLHAF